ncbi:DUF3316 domain-containing protein [Psychromonas sp. KJ10-10]|uniref:DUF3316 domain-containing protein n=1 Tax=Psychromonas sp. KJ10-10 TaxID=3391823 RepID=UPI0039B578AD
MKKLMTIVAGVLLTGSVFAHTVTLHKNDQLVTAEYASKSEAVDAGFDLAEALKSNSNSELRKEFNLVGHTFVRNITVDNTEVSTEEFADTRDETKYRAIVKVSYYFDAEDNND